MRFIFRPQASKTNQRQNKHRSDFRRSLTNLTQLTTLSLVFIGLGLSTPQAARAETARIDGITIDRQPDETYDKLIQRAESAAITALQQGFSQAQITDVSVIILGQNQGVIAPVLSVEVSRPQWNGGSNGFTYFNSARSLLRLDEQQLATVDSPQPPGTTPRVPSRPQQNNSNPRPGSARELINSTPVQPVNPPTGAAPLPGSPALVPRPQAPGVTPVTSPGDNLDTPPPLPATATPVTAPTPQNLPQVSPTTNPTPNLP